MSGRLSNRNPWEQSIPRSEETLSYAEHDARVAQEWYAAIEKDRRRLRNRLKRLYHRISRYGAVGTTNSIVFVQLSRRTWAEGGKQYQFNIKRSWEGFGLGTWPPLYNGTQKRALCFGVGYISWRIS